jgi:hypothetical protein
VDQNYYYYETSTSKNVTSFFTKSSSFLVGRQPIEYYRPGGLIFPVQNSLSAFRVSGDKPELVWQVEEEQWKSAIFSEPLVMKKKLWVVASFPEQNYCKI